MPDNDTAHDDALFNGPGIPTHDHARGGATAQGYVLQDQQKWPMEMKPDPEQGTPIASATAAAGTRCCGCSRKTCIIVTVVVLLIAGAGGLAAGLAIGLKPKHKNPSPPPPSPPPPPPVITLDCHTDQDCSQSGVEYSCIQGGCTIKLADIYQCTSDADCFSGKCGNANLIGLSGNDSCLLSTGNVCKRADACASGVCTNGGGGGAVRYCQLASRVEMPPTVALAQGSTCLVDIDCGGTSRCAQGQCTTKLLYGEACTSGSSCFQSNCVRNDGEDHRSCHLPVGATCSDDKYCGNFCSNFYCA